MLRMGFDAVRIGRVARSIQKPRFCERIFSPEENRLINSRPGGACKGAALRDFRL